MVRPDDLTVPEDVLLRDLRYHWGEAYVISFDPDGDEGNPWLAVRRDDPAAVFRRETSSALRDTMRINYREHPVPRGVRDEGGLDL